MNDYIYIYIYKYHCASHRTAQKGPGSARITAPTAYCSAGFGAGLSTATFIQPGLRILHK